MANLVADEGFVVLCFKGLGCSFRIQISSFRFDEAMFMNYGFGV